MKNILKNHRFLAGFLSVVISVFLTAVAVYAATTIGTNINTGGTVTMESASTTNDFWLGNVIGDDDDYLYFDASSSEYLIWDDNPGQFQLSDDLLINGNATTTGNLLVGTASWGGASATSTFIVAGSAFFSTKATSSQAFSIGNSGTVDVLDMTGGDLYVQDDVEIDGSATTTLSHYIGGTASTTQLFVQGTGHFGGNTSVDGTFISLGAATTTLSHYIGGTASTTALQVQGATHIGGNTTMDGTLAIGTSTNAISKFYFGTCTVNLNTSIAADTASTTNCAATGVKVADKVFLTPTILEKGIVFHGASSTADDIIQVRVFNASTTAAITAGSNTWYWMAIR